MADELPVLESSDGWRNGLCGAFDGETTCVLPRDSGHPWFHRFRDPSGTGRWIDKDPFGVEVARGPLEVVWMGESPLRRRDHQFLPQHYPGEDVDLTPHLRDVGRCCGLVRAAAVHAASEAVRVAAEMLAAGTAAAPRLLPPARPVMTVGHTAEFSREVLEDAPALVLAFEELLAGTRLAPPPEPAGPPTWEARVAYMTALHALVRWAHRELDRAQLGDPATHTGEVRGLIGNLDDARWTYGERASGILDE